MKRDIEDVLKPCVSVISSEIYRRVLDRIVEIWSAGGSPSYYIKRGLLRVKTAFRLL
jgi:hypothetical protein